ncbi:MAG TPA: response regulator [Flavobacterium sp.]|nr:response regulator [Flavobacterium sp.]
MKLTCVIIDDEPDAQEILRLYCNKCGFITIKGVCSNAVEAMHLLNETDADFIFLDIEMPEINGLALMRLLKDTTKVIFTTAYSEYAIEGYEFNVVDYLLKPIAFERFLKAVKKMVPKPEETLPQMIKLNHIHKPVSPNEIVFVESVGNYAKIIFTASNAVIHGTLKDIYGQLEPYGFIRCHKRYIINCMHILSVGNDNIMLSDKKQIPIGISYRQKVRLILKDFIKP